MERKVILIGKYPASSNYISSFLDEAILIRNGTFAWNDADEKAALNEINLSVKPGQLVAIVGPVGCGKSSLLSAILGDMESKGSLVYVKVL